MKFSSYIHVAVNGIILFFLWLSSIPFKYVTQILLLLFFFSVSCLFRATPAVYGSSQTRGLIGSVAASHATATATATPDPGCVCDLHHSSRQRHILNTLSKARDRTRNLMVPSQIRFCCTTTGTPNTAS